jgi:hypothetical protein
VLPSLNFPQFDFVKPSNGFHPVTWERVISEGRTLVEAKKRFFWHDRTKSLRMVVRQCQRCQLAKSLRNIRFGIEEMKSIPICDLFYRVALDTIGLLLETKNGNRYVLVAIDNVVRSKTCQGP